MNWEILTKWYTLLPTALAVGPVFSVLGIDSFVHNIILKSGGGKSLTEKNEVTRTIDAVVVGSPFWIAVSSIFLQPFWGGGFPVKYVTLLLAGGVLKLLYGRSYIYDTAIEDSSRWWNPLWQRKPNDLWEEIGRMFTKFAYPSSHTLAIAGAVLFGVHSPAAWILLGVAVLWLVASHHHWFSDVLAAGAFVAAFADIFGR
jgi:hypothetical protein